jgi:cysteinyl-tRNA synthetase
LVQDNSLPLEDRYATLLACDAVLGLNIADVPKFVITDHAKDLLSQRDTARANKDFAQSDALRTELEALGYTVLDSADGTLLQ